MVVNEFQSPDQDLTVIVDSNAQKVQVTRIAPEKGNEHDEYDVREGMVIIEIRDLHGNLLAKIDCVKSPT